MPFNVVDLHLHSCFSDGVLTPAQLCERAQKAGITCLALTDHDTVAGIAAMEEAAAQLNAANGEDADDAGNAADHAGGVDDAGNADSVENADVADDAGRVANRADDVDGAGRVANRADDVDGAGSVVNHVDGADDAGNTDHAGSADDAGNAAGVDGTDRATVPVDRAGNAADAANADPRIINFEVTDFFDPRSVDLEDPSLDDPRGSDLDGLGLADPRIFDPNDLSPEAFEAARQAEKRVMDEFAAIMSELFGIPDPRNQAAYPTPRGQDNVVMFPADRITHAATSNAGDGASPSSEGDGDSSNGGDNASPSNASDTASPSSNHDNASPSNASNPSSSESAEERHRVIDFPTRWTTFFPPRGIPMSTRDPNGNLSIIGILPLTVYRNDAPPSNKDNAPSANGDSASPNGDTSPSTNGNTPPAPNIIPLTALRADILRAQRRATELASPFAANAAARNRPRASRNSPPPPLHIIRGIELSTGEGGRTHILGYGIRPDDPALTAFLADSQADRTRRAVTIFQSLASLGVPIDEATQAELLAIPTVGRAHIARALVAAGHVNTVDQAFERYLAEGRPAYAPRRTIAPAEGVRLIRQAGGVAVLAHPHRLGVDARLIGALLDELAAAGLDGVEALHPSANRAGAHVLAQMARRRGLLVTGGSDFHSPSESRARLGHMPLPWTSAADDVEALLALIEARSK